MKKLLAAALFAALMLTACTTSTPSSSKPWPDFTSVPPFEGEKLQPDREPLVNTEMGYKAIWISYLEWQNLDTTSQEAFTKSVGTMLDNCVSLGVNRAIVQVRPFADAIYESAMFPKSHLLTGTQGKGTPFDAFAIFIEQAHLRNIGIEAWINPYRIALNSKVPNSYADNNLKNTHPSWVKEVNNGLYLEPSNPEIQQYIIDGVKEVCSAYDIDGVQFDDYFYPTTDASFDATEHAALGAGKPLDAWRRENVNALIKGVYAAIKEINPEMVFGISPQGNNDNNYNQQYSDVSLWLSEEGYCDYVMPQLYWGFEYLTKSGSKRFQFEALTKEWAAIPRPESIKLYIGIGAWRIGAGDGGANAQDEWQTGNNIAKMVAFLNNQPGIDGYALYRYDSFYNNNEHQELALKEASSLEKYNANK